MMNQWPINIKDIPISRREIYVNWRMIDGMICNSSHSISVDFYPYTSNICHHSCQHQRPHQKLKMTKTPPQQLSSSVDEFFEPQALTPLPSVESIVSFLICNDVFTVFGGLHYLLILKVIELLHHKNIILHLLVSTISF